MKRIIYNHKGFTQRNSAGFTLIELLIVIGILTTLIAVTISIINPGKQISKANNAKRNSDINVILAGIGQYESDNKGALPASITSTQQNISKTGADLCSTLVTQYMASLPQDPTSNGGKPISDCSSNYDTNYTVVKSGTDNRITITAPSAEIGDTISVTR